MVAFCSASPLDNVLILIVTYLSAGSEFDFNLGSYPRDVTSPKRRFPQPSFTPAVGRVEHRLSYSNISRKQVFLSGSSSRSSPSNSRRTSPHALDPVPAPGIASGCHSCARIRWPPYPRISTRHTLREVRVTLRPRPLCTGGSVGSPDAPLSPPALPYGSSQPDIR